MNGQVAHGAADDSARERLWDAAVSLFNSKGYAATTVREIAAAAGVTKPVVYYYFGSKEGIYLEIMRHAFMHLGEIADRGRASTGTCFERVLALFGEAYALFEEHIGEARLIYACHFGPPQGAPEFDHRAFHENFEGSLRTIIQAGVEAGELRGAPVEEIAAALLGVLDTAMTTRLVEPERAPRREGLGRILTLVFEGVAVGLQAESKGAEHHA